MQIAVRDEPRSGGAGRLDYGLYEAFPTGISMFAANTRVLTNDAHGGLRLSTAVRCSPSSSMIWMRPAALRTRCRIAPLLASRRQPAPDASPGSNAGVCTGGQRGLPPPPPTGIDFMEAARPHPSGGHLWCFDDSVIITCLKVILADAGEVTDLDAAAVWGAFYDMGVRGVARNRDQ